MKGTKDCWNPACICWCHKSDTSNCASEDIEPQDCRLADVDFRTVINIFNLHMKPESVEAKRLVCPKCNNHDIMQWINHPENGFLCLICKHTWGRKAGSENVETEDAFWLRLQADTPNKISFYYMHDNHTFSKLKGRTLEQIADHCYEIREHSHYGMLCPVILLRDDKEIRRVGEPVHCSGPRKDDLWFTGINEWKQNLKTDKDVMRLLLTNEPYPKKFDI